MIKYLFIITLFLSCNLSAEIIKTLEVKGNVRISAETIKVYGGINLNEDYSSFDVDKVLKNLYSTEFFKNVKVSISNEVLIVNVEEYTVLNNVAIEGEKSTKIKEALLENIKLKSKSSFIKNKINNDIKIIKKLYSSIGFNFASVEAKIENFDNNRVNLTFFIARGKKTDIEKINFIGDKKIKEKRLRDVIASEEKKFWKFLSGNTFLSKNNIDLDKRLLTNYYKSLGFYDVQVLSDSAEISKDNFTTLTYTINAGDRYKINKISTNVSEVLDKKLFLPLEKNFKKTVGKYYSPFTVKKLLDELDLLIASNDLQFIEHSVNEVLGESNIEIKINIYEGSKQLVERINITGNTITNESVIRSDLLLDEGDPFNTLKLDQSISNIKSRNIFAKVEKNITAGKNKDQKIINILVEEKPTGEISAGAGVGTAGGSLGFQISENNWLGKGMTLAAEIDASKETVTGSLSITDPNYNFSGNSLGFSIMNQSNDKTSTAGYKNNLIAGSVGTRFEQYRDIYLSPGLAFSYDTLEVEETASKSLQKQKGTFTDLSFDYKISLDKRNRTYGPTDGYISNFSQAFPIYADSPYINNTYSFSKYKALTPDVISNFKFYTSAINGLSNKDVRINKRLYLPSSKLRGFQPGKIGPKDGKDYVGGNYAIASNFELNLPNLLPETTKTDVGLFLDFGNLWNVDYDSSVNGSNKIRSSAGINTQWLSPVGPMSFIFAQNITKASTDITQGFKFQLGTTF